jgi:hydroxyethylthiazole kinase-like uncharacterized protein yjeF
MLMERAGLASARLALALAPHARRVLVLAGPGNNGGDGLVAARHLHAAGMSVMVRSLADLARCPADAAHAWRQASAAGVPCAPFAADERLAMGSNDVVIDALLGLGARRAPEGAMAAAIAAVNTQACTRLAIDLPSGLHPDTGALLGSQAVQAHATLSLLTLKPGCFTAAGRDHAGQVWWDSLGEDAPAVTAWLSGPAACSARRHAAHKGSHGDLMVVGGASGMSGAAWLAASAALAAGAGRVYVSLLDEKAGATPLRPELMRQPGAWLLPAARLAALNLVCGCGGGQAVAAALPPLLAHARRLVLDADALNAIASDSQLRQQLLARSRRGQPSVLTPHPLEAARLLGCSAHDVQAERLASAQTLAVSLGCVVVLKGSGSVVAAPGITPNINCTGNAALATAGTGDVLAGWIGGLWAQHGDDAALSTAMAVTTAAVWLHGAAADRHQALGRHGPLRAADLIEAMAAAPGQS